MAIRSSAAVLAIAISLWGGAQESSATLEADAERAMKLDTPTFAERATLVGQIDEARSGARGETAARLALLWLRAVKWMLASIPLAQRDGEPHHDWIARHQEIVVYSEPAGEWLIYPDVVWKLHEQYRQTAVAEDIAWLAVQNGLPGECEGYVPCYAQGLNTLDAEYLRRYPSGRHVEEIMERVTLTLDQSLRLIGEPDRHQFLNPSTDCGDLKDALLAVRTAVARSTPGAKHDHAVAAADQILAMCP